MLEIRADQWQMFRAAGRESFVRRVATYLREEHAGSVRDMTDEALAERVRRQLTVGARYGIDTEAAAVQFVVVGLAYGEDFHSSWKYPEAERILSSGQEGNAKMRALLEAAREGFTRTP